MHDGLISSTASENDWNLAENDWNLAENQSLYIKGKLRQAVKLWLPMVISGKLVFWA